MGEISIIRAFECPISQLFDNFVSNDAMTCLSLGSKANVVPSKGGEYSLFNGHIHGNIENIEAPKKICLALRWSSWREGQVSKVHFSFKSLKNNETEVSMKQTNIPSSDAFDNDCKAYCLNGWQQNVFDRIPTIWGYAVVE